MADEAVDQCAVDEVLGRPTRDEDEPDPECLVCQGPDAVETAVRGDATPSGEIEGYCVKERKKVFIAKPEQVRMTDGRTAIQGSCPGCGTRIFKIV